MMVPMTSITFGFCCLSDVRGRVVFLNGKESTKSIGKSKETRRTSNSKFVEIVCKHMVPIYLYKKTMPVYNYLSKKITNIPTSIGFALGQ